MLNIKLPKQLFLLTFFVFAGLFVSAQNNYPDTLNRKKLRAAIITQASFYVAGTAYLYNVWYHDSERVPFHYYKDGKGYNQIDKFGHAYGSYVYSSISYHWFRSAGLSKTKSLIFGGTMGLVMQTPIEIFDGIYEGWGFSWSDMAGNAAGSALLISQEILFDRQLFQYKFSYSYSDYAKQANGYLGENYIDGLFYDYNGHTYWLSTGINNFVLKEKLPDWLNLAIGYSAGGMFGEFENISHFRGETIPEKQRYRQFLLAPDIDWTKLKTKSKFLKGLFFAMNFVKLPAPALEYNSKGEFKTHLLYF